MEKDVRINLKANLNDVFRGEPLIPQLIAACAETYDIPEHAQEYAEVFEILWHLVEYFVGRTLEAVSRADEVVPTLERMATAMRIIGMREFIFGGVTGIGMKITVVGDDRAVVAPYSRTN